MTNKFDFCFQGVNDTSMPHKRIVLKFGTGILTRLKGDGLDKSQFAALTSAVASLVSSGHQCVVVSSGSIGAGMMTLGLADRPKDLPAVQACAAVGQSQLMRLYDMLFSKHGLKVAQVLLTHQDMDSRTRHHNARNTIQHLLDHGSIVPIINENDTVAVEEIKFGDNDRLSAEVAVMIEADLLILLTSVDGLIKGKDLSGPPVPFVRDIDKALQLVNTTVGKLSVGGMHSKLQAAKVAVNYGIPVVITNGRKAELIADVVSGKSVGTRFPVRHR